MEIRRSDWTTTSIPSRSFWMLADSRANGPATLSPILAAPYISLNHFPELQPASRSVFSVTHASMCTPLGLPPRTGRSASASTLIAHLLIGRAKPDEIKMVKAADSCENPH